MDTARLDLLVSYMQPGAIEDTAGLADVVAEMCTDDREPLTQAEAQIAYDILCRLYPDAERAVRQRLADRLADRPDVPRALCILLANDAIEIAGPVIRRGHTLEDDDLVRLVVEKDRPYQLAVAERVTLSARVTDVLVYLADADVALALARNHGARFSGHGLKRLVNASRTQPSLQKPLLERTDLTEEMAQLMYDWVGQALKTFIRETFGLDVERSVGSDVDAAVSTAVSNSGSSPGAGDRYPESFGSLLVAARRGDLRTMERETRVLARLPSHSVQRLLYNGDGKALAVLCRALGAGRALYAEIFSRLYGTPPYNVFSQSREFKRAMAFFDQLPLDEAKSILVHWRLRPETVWGDPARYNAAWEMRQRMDQKN